MDIAMAVLALMERQRVRLLVRREQFNRFYSCLVYIPRDRFNTENREKIQDILYRAFQGEQLDYNVQISESRLARLQVSIRPRPGAATQPDVHSWKRRLSRRSVPGTTAERHSGAEVWRGGRAWPGSARSAQAFPAAFIRRMFRPGWPASMSRISPSWAMNDDLKMSLYRPRSNDSALIRFKLFKRGRPIPLSQVLPILENLGLNVVNERPYR